MKINLVYIGDRFYNESRSIMSSIYLEYNLKLERYDYGFLQRDLREGCTINIRQATKEELKKFEKQLEKIKKS